ncbi:MAG: LPPG:FO 2-phospho-L-lactate transferase, partial [Natronomonas sp.]
VEFAGDQLAELPVTGDEPRDPVGIEAVVGEDPGDRTLPDEPLDVVVVLPGVTVNERLDVVAVRGVADIVQEGGSTHTLGLAALDPEMVERAVGEVIDTEAVLKAGVVGGGVDQDNSPQLSDVPEPLDGRGLQQVPGHALDRDVVVDAVLDRRHCVLLGGPPVKASVVWPGSRRFMPRQNRMNSMVTFLSGGTGTPKLLSGAGPVFDPGETTVVANTGDDIEIAGHLVCPDLDTVLFLGGDVLDRETWWGIDDDGGETHARLAELAEAAGVEAGPRYLPSEAQTAGREIARWRRFSGVAEFMYIGDRDRAVHITRTGLLDEGESLTAVTRTLADAYDVPWELLPMSDDPVATLVDTPQGLMHFQEFWVAREGEPTVEAVEFRGAERAQATDAVLDALSDPVVVGPSNPVTSVGPLLAVSGVPEALAETTVVAVSPFVEDRVFSGPAADLMAGVGYEPSTAGVAEAYPFADAFVLDSDDGTGLDRPVVRTDTTLDTETDATRVARAVREALEVAG